jgi:hypothetical protein
MYKFTVTLCVAALAAWIMTETMLTQEIQIHVAMGTNRAVLEIGASVKPSPVPLAFRAARLFGRRIEEIFHDQDPAPL